MTLFIGSRTDAVLFVNDTLESLKYGSQWTMTITRGRSGAYYVSCVINESSEIIEKKARDSLRARMNISPENTQDG
jgi:hypothetical protein